MPVEDPADPVRICNVWLALGRFAMVELDLVRAVTVKPE